MSIRWALVLAMVFPTFISILYFVVLPGNDAGQNRPMQVAFGLGKVLQFSIPLLYLLIWDRSQLRLSAPNTRGLGIGLTFGLATGIAALGLYFFMLRGTGPFPAMGERVQKFLGQQGFGTAGGFILFAVGYSVFHSLAEEYYWRWFVFGQMRRSAFRETEAAVISGLAFMSHHVILLNHYLPGYFWLGVVPLSLGVAVGGMAWAWMYQRYRSIYAIWASHMLVDAAIMVIGYDLLTP